MGFDLSVRFSDPQWYRENRSKVIDLANALPSALTESPSNEEVWLKDADSSDPWAYEVRILPREDSLDVEVMGFGGTFHRDVRRFMASLAALTDVLLVDDDGEPV
jgi:hypothetical protein